jgi:hypothetical protein
MQCNTGFAHADQGVVLRLTRKERQFSRICERELVV